MQIFNRKSLDGVEPPQDFHLIIGLTPVNVSGGILSMELLPKAV